MNLSDDQIQQLIAGGDCALHHHSSDKVIDHSQIDKFQEELVFRTLSATGPIYTNDDIILLDTTSGSVTATLPYANNGKEYVFVKVASANSGIINFTGGQFSLGASSITLSALGDTCKLKANGTAWVPEYKAVAGGASANDYANLQAFAAAHG